MTKQAKHRHPYRFLKYPIGVYIYMAKNRWYCFIKPDLKKKINQFRNKQ